jgi:hypothetical protein
MTIVLGSKNTPAGAWPADLKFLHTDAGGDLGRELDLVLLEADGDAPDVLEEFDGPTPKNKDHAANYAALKEVLGMATWVIEAVEREGTLYGYWHGPEGVPLKDAPIVSYDSEGTISLKSGQSLLEVLICDACYEDDDRFDELKKRVAKHGVKLTAATWANYDSPRPCKTDPKELHDKLYEQNKKKAAPAAKKPRPGKSK